MKDVHFVYLSSKNEVWYVFKVCFYTFYFEILMIPFIQIFYPFYTWTLFLKKFYYFFVLINSFTIYLN